MVAIYLQANARTLSKSRGSSELLGAVPMSSRPIVLEACLQYRPEAYERNSFLMTSVLSSFWNPIRALYLSSFNKVKVV